MRVIKQQIIITIVVISSALTGVAFSQKLTIAPAPNGITLPIDYKDWRVIATSHRTDNNTLRVILGNDIAVQAAREAKTNPWPEGTILAKLVWKETTHKKWPVAITPGNFVHTEFMVKHTKKYASTGGWGFARWVGMEQQPYGKDIDFAKECFDCHLLVKDHDYVFTQPVQLP